MTNIYCIKYHINFSKKINWSQVINLIASLTNLKSIKIYDNHL